MLKNPTVLIIEDDPVFRRVLGLTATKSNLSVLTASGGEEGFDLLMNNQIEFIVTDLQMPGCGGIELLQRLDAVEHYHRPPTILCTAKGLELDSEQLKRDFRLTAILHKPFSPRQLSDLLLKHLNPNSDSQERASTPNISRSQYVPHHPLTAGTGNV